MLIPELEEPTYLKKSSTLVRATGEVQLQCAKPIGSREAIQQPGPDEIALGAIRTILSNSACEASRRGTSSRRDTSDIEENKVSFVRREVSARSLLRCGG